MLIQFPIKGKIQFEIRFEIRTQGFHGVGCVFRGFVCLRRGLILPVFSHSPVGAVYHF